MTTTPKRSGSYVGKIENPTWCRGFIYRDDLDKRADRPARALALLAEVCP